MIKKMMVLIKAVVYRNLRIHRDTDGRPTGFSIVGVDVATFDSTPFEEVLASSGLGWTLTVFEAKQATIPNPAGGERIPAINADGTPRMLVPSVYIGQSGDSLDDLATMLEEVV